MPNPSNKKNRRTAKRNKAAPPARVRDSFHLRRAADWVRGGGIIAYPTEAVYGLGCEPGDYPAVRRLLTLKRRPLSKGLILVASDWSQLRPWLRALSRTHERRLLQSWPGPVTWLVPAAADCPRWLTGDHDTLAVRISAHPLVQGLCSRIGSALVSTSANVSTRPPARTPLQVRLHFGDSLDYLLPGPLGDQTRPTQIRDLVSGRIVRA